MTRQILTWVILVPMRPARSSCRTQETTGADIGWSSKATSARKRAQRLRLRTRITCAATSHTNEENRHEMFHTIDCLRIGPCAGRVRCPDRQLGFPTLVDLARGTSWVNAHVRRIDNQFDRRRSLPEQR